MLLLLTMRARAYYAGSEVPQFGTVCMLKSFALVCYSSVSVQKAIIAPSRFTKVGEFAPKPWLG